MPTSLSEKNYMGDLLKYESGENSLYARDNGTLIAGQNLALGAVLGKISIGGLTSAVKSGGNTGNGVVTVDPTTPILVNARTGIYSARVTVAGANSATFRVTDPLGDVLGDFAYAGAGAVGAFADQIKFTITDGATDFVVGDGFDLTVAAGSTKYTQLAPGAADGSQVAVAVLLATTDATAADVNTPIVARTAMLTANRVLWPAGITAPQKTLAIQQLQAVGIILRTGV